MIWYSNSEGRFGANGAKGDRGEKLVEEYCLNNNISFESRTDFKSQVHLKIDCIINNTPVDVKTNTNNGYLVVELYTKKSTPGWLYTTTAEQIYGVDIEKKEIYRYNISEMLKYVSKNKSRAKKTAKGDVLMWVSVNNDFIERLI